MPNNMAICMSGDLDPDATIALIDKYFGGLKPNPELPKLDASERGANHATCCKRGVRSGCRKRRIGLEIPGVSDKDFEILQVVSQVLYNGKAGLIDLDLNQQQKRLE